MLPCKGLMEREVQKWLSALNHNITDQTRARTQTSWPVTLSVPNVFEQSLRKKVSPLSKMVTLFLSSLTTRPTPIRAVRTSVVKRTKVNVDVKICHDRETRKTLASPLKIIKNPASSELQWPRWHKDKDYNPWRKSLKMKKQNKTKQTNKQTKTNRTKKLAQIKDT